jgi:hypothetical protein
MERHNRNVKLESLPRVTFDLLQKIRPFTLWRLAMAINDIGNQDGCGTQMNEMNHWVEDGT